MMKRSAGVLLHPTSLPGPYGIGTLGKTARQWIDLLHEAGQRLWQILPLGPVGHGFSPYQCFSAFAGNPMLIDPEQLIEAGLLTYDDLKDTPSFVDNMVDFERVEAFNASWLDLAVKRFKGSRPYDRFSSENDFWLDDYALFMALREHFDHVSWLKWPLGINRRRADALTEYRSRLADRIHYHKVIQFFFFDQWNALREYARAKQVFIVGDLPIYVSMESADVWSQSHYFQLDEARKPTHVAGVPPDYFSETGQRWGNPLFDWDAMKQDGYAWWISRLSANLAMYDYVRIDHFRGFEAYWSIPAEEETAINGEWIDGPNHALFEAFETALGKNLPIIAEDLGIITPEVEALRDDFKLPGMKILQFAFGGDAGNPYLPHNHVPHSIVYTGTHDNDTTNGWFYDLANDSSERAYVLEYLQCNDHDFHKHFIRAAFASSAVWAIIPMQDLIGYGSVARMNTPGTALGNWHWRLNASQMHDAPWSMLKQLGATYGR